MSVVDQSPMREGSNSGTALRETIELAVATEKLGYQRYWVAEHHNLPNFAGTAPEVMVGQIAAHTRRIRVGSGGVMLPHYSALKVAETFRILDSLYPDRIDLGIGRAPGSDQITAAALAYPSMPKDVRHFPQQVRGRDQLPGGHAAGRPPIPRSDGVAGRRNRYCAPGMAAGLPVRIGVHGGENGATLRLRPLFRDGRDGRPADCGIVSAEFRGVGIPVQTVGERRGASVVRRYRGGGAAHRVQPEPGAAAFGNRGAPRVSRRRSWRPTTSTWPTSGSSSSSICATAWTAPRNR